jgi:hypothetical protein
VQDGTTIIYGQGHRIHISSQQYKALLNHFQGQTVPAGTPRTNRPPNSVGEWLSTNVTKTAVASYVCPILIEECCAERVENSKLKFF